MSRDTFKKALSAVEVNPGFPDLTKYMSDHAKVLLQEKKISKMPDWKTALRTDFMQKAQAGA
jgi:hypothetical protein